MGQLCRLWQVTTRYTLPRPSVELNCVYPCHGLLLPKNRTVLWAGALTKVWQKMWRRPKTGPCLNSRSHTLMSHVHGY